MTSAQDIQSHDGIHHVCSEYLKTDPHFCEFFNFSQASAKKKHVGDRKVHVQARIQLFMHYFFQPYCLHSNEAVSSSHVRELIVLQICQCIPLDCEDIYAVEIPKLVFD